MTKGWYASKTVWVNAIAIVAIIAGKEILTPEIQTTILAVINIILRLVTKKEISWK